MAYYALFLLLVAGAGMLFLAWPHPIDADPTVVTCNGRTLQPGDGQVCDVRETHLGTVLDQYSFDYEEGVQRNEKAIEDSKNGDPLLREISYAVIGLAVAGEIFVFLRYDEEA